MKKRIILLGFIAFMMQFSTLTLSAQSRDNATWVASEQHFQNQQTVIDPFTIGDYVQCQFAKGTGSSTPTYFTSNASVRLYANNTVTFTPLNGASIQQIILTCKKQGSKPYLMIGTYTEGTLVDPASTSSTDIVETVWTGDNNKGLTFTMAGSGQRCIIQIDVVYTSPTNTYYHLTYTANGGVGNDIVESHVYNSSVPVIACPFDRDEFVFANWNTSADGSGTPYNPGATIAVTEDITLYAQWTTSINLFVDVFNPTNVNAAIGDTTGYINWEMSLPNSESPRVTYRGKSSKNSNYIQMNSSISGTSSYSGIVTTHTTNLKAKKVKVTWHDMTDADRTLDIYGKNTPFSGTTDLYGETQGTLLGSIVKGTSSELDIEALASTLGSFSYLGIRSQSGAVYLSEIRIIWETLDTTAPIVLIEPSSVDLGNVVVNNPLSVSFTVSQANLSENLTLSATNGIGTLSVNGETVTTIVAGADPTVVTWSYTPEVQNDDFSVQVVATSGNATSSITITAKVLPASAQSLHESKAAFVTNGNTSACINLANVEVIGQSGYYLYLQDADAGVLVYGAGAPALHSGDIFVSGYLMGTYEDYHGIIEIKNFQFVNPTTTSGQLTAVQATVDQILANTSAYDSRYVELSNVNISNWTVAGTNASLAFHDRFQTGYATKTAPETTDAFTVKGLVNGYYANSTTNYQIDPVALTDISTTVKAGAPYFSSSGTATTPSTATTVLLTPATNTVAYYSINGGEFIPFTTWTYVNLTNPTSEMVAYGTRDFYANSDNVLSYYQLPANSFTVSFSINGVVDAANNAVVSGQLQENQTPSVTTYGDFAFAGWSTSENSTQTITLPCTISDNTTLYAVYVKGQEFVYKKVNSVSEFVDGEYVILAEGSHGEFAIKNTSSTHSPTAFNINDLGLTISNENTLEGGDLSELTWNFNGTSSNMTITSTANPTNYLYIIGNSSTGVRVGHTSENTSWSITEDLNVTAMFNMQCNGRYLVVYNDQDWRSYANLNNSNSYPRLLLFKKQAVVSAGGPRYTRVFWNETATSDIAIAGPSIVPSGYYLNMNDKNMTNTTPANLLIEDNASLKLTYGDTGVKATVQKNIVGYVYDTVRTGWHLLSSPVGEFSTADDRVPSGLMNGNYDLYAFNQALAMEWQNVEVEGVDVVCGEQGGVLYASKANTTITFTGTLTAEVTPKDLDCEPNVRMSGWNLIGNPYTSQGYLTVQYNGEGEAVAITDYYKLEDVSVNGKKFSKLIATSIEEPVSPMEGVFVQAPTAGYEYWFVNSNRGQNVVQSDYLNIKVSDNDGEVMDMARVRFDQGGLLGKFNFNENDSQLYIPIAGKDYAVVPSQHQGELPLNFKTAEDGSYTIGVDLEKANMDYLHLIDNMTGADVDLLADPTYTFDAKASDYASRFRLVFASVCEDADGGASTGSASFAYFNGSEWVVMGTESDAILQVIDITGRVVVSKSAQVGISANEMSQGIYVLRLISGDSVKTQKIINK